MFPIQSTVAKKKSRGNTAIKYTSNNNDVYKRTLGIVMHTPGFLNLNKSIINLWAFPHLHIHTHLVLIFRRVLQMSALFCISDLFECVDKHRAFINI